MWHVPHVCFGSAPNIVPCPIDVCFTPESEHQSDTAECPLCAKQTGLCLSISKHKPESWPYGAHAKIDSICNHAGSCR